MPFARNDATKFISPTKTPEYLAAGKPVVSTSIRDVVRPYGEKGFVKIADTAEEFVDACRESLSEDFTQKLSKEIDPYLSQMSWDRTWAEMRTLVLNLLEEKSNSLMEISY
jgi:UDP-galactopyranose mutase